MNDHASLKDILYCFVRIVNLLYVHLSQFTLALNLAAGGKQQLDHDADGLREPQPELSGHVLA
jgi:hypothetical protein